MGYPDISNIDQKEVENNFMKTIKVIKVIVNNDITSYLTDRQVERLNKEFN